MDHHLRNFRALFLAVAGMICVGRVMLEVEKGPFSPLGTLLLELATFVTLSGVTGLVLVPWLQRRTGLRGRLRTVGPESPTASAPPTAAGAPPPTAAPTRRRAPAASPSPVRQAPREESHPPSWNRSSSSDPDEDRRRHRPELPWHGLRPQPEPRRRRAAATGQAATAPEKGPEKEIAHATVSPLSGTGGAASPPKGKRPLHIWLEAGIEEPLEKTSAFAKILFDEHQEALSEEGRICLTKLIKNARSARERLRALIDYLRTSQLSCRTETLPARPLLDRVLEELDEQIREGQVKLTVDRSLPEVLGDPDLIRIALHEILGNAVKFNNKDERLVSVKGIVEGNRALLMIADNGIGIDVGEEAAIFEPFTRGLRAGLYEGAGLGLARARSCAERMGGSIRVESVAGEGTTFILDLAAPPTPATSTELPDVNFRYARPGARFS